MRDCKVKILGTEWSVKFGGQSQYPALSDCDGYADATTKTIVVDDMKYAGNDPANKGNLEEFVKQNLRHEIIHAFMEESGLSHNFQHPTMGIDETIVDWYAIQAPKIHKIFLELGCMW